MTSPTDHTMANIVAGLTHPDVELRAIDIAFGASPVPNGPIMEHVPNGTTVWTITTYNAKADQRDNDQ